jgi:hypothetical protein
MTYVSEHDGKEEWKGGDRKQAWIDFLIPRNTVGVDYLLEGSSEFIQSEVSWRLSIVGQLVDLTLREVVACPLKVLECHFYCL